MGQTRKVAKQELGGSAPGDCPTFGKRSWGFVIAIPSANGLDNAKCRLKKVVGSAPRPVAEQEEKRKGTLTIGARGEKKRTGIPRKDGRVNAGRGKSYTVVPCETMGDHCRSSIVTKNKTRATEVGQRGGAENDVLWGKTKNKPYPSQKLKVGRPGLISEDSGYRRR